MKFIDELLRQLAPMKKDPIEHLWFQSMQNAQVFDINNITHLLPEWGTSRSSNLPVRPPFDETWVEFRFDSKVGETEGHLQIGTIFKRMPVGSKVDNTIIADNLVENMFASMTFIKVVRVKGEKYRDVSNFMTIIDRMLFMFLTDTGSIKYVSSSPPRTLFNIMRFPLVEYLDEEDVSDSVQYFESIWQPLMAFSLLHCRNITSIATIPPAKLQKATIKRGHPPLVTYRTISLKVDDELKKRYLRPEDEAEDERARQHVRFHLVRGHFKHLTHERFRNPGLYWWPQHWRGDPDAGTLLKDYKLTTSHSPTHTTEETVP